MSGEPPGHVSVAQHAGNPESRQAHLLVQKLAQGPLVLLPQALQLPVVLCPGSLRLPLVLGQGLLVGTLLLRQPLCVAPPFPGRGSPSMPPSQHSCRHQAQQPHWAASPTVRTAAGHGFTLTPSKSSEPNRCVLRVHLGGENHCPHMPTIQRSIQTAHNVHPGSRKSPH